MILYNMGSKLLGKHRKKHLRKQVLFSTMCFAYAERDVPFGRDVSFGSEVCLRHVLRNTSHHCERSEQHHCA